LTTSVQNCLVRANQRDGEGGDRRWLAPISVEIKERELMRAHDVKLAELGKLAPYGV
jgi:hypothetical protein